MNRTLEPDWDLYRSLLAVLREGSLSGAARALGLTQPTLTRHIDTLETALGQTLFTRSQRGLSATEAALALRPYAESLAGTVAALRRAAGDGGATVAGTVRITASEVMGALVLPPILTDLNRRHPALTIDLDLSNRVENLLRRDADIAVRMVEPVQDALLVQRVGTVSLGFHAHRSYASQRGLPTAPEALVDHTTIGYATETPLSRRVRQALPWLDAVRFTLKADSDLAQWSAIRAGFGIGICQLALARQQPDLVPVLPDHFRFDLGVWVVMHEDLRQTPRCRACFDALVAGLRDHVER